MTQATPVLGVHDLSISVRTAKGLASIIDHVSFDVAPGEIVGLVGESGCGKSTIVKAILGVLGPALTVTSGRIHVAGRDMSSLSEAELARSVRGSDIGFVPQDPGLALNPMFRVGDQLLEIWKYHAPAGLPDRSRAAGERRLIDIMKQIQMPDPGSVLHRYPHEFSGGQRQRVLIAAALLCEPKLIVADEPTTALDVTIQQQILHLLGEIASRLNVGVLFVTHDFGVVSQLCDRVVVMYAGQVAETGDKSVVLDVPGHPYTRALLACHPDRMTHLQGIPGTVPPIGAMPTGCRFHPRCTHARAACPSRPAKLIGVSPGQSVNCILAEPEGHA